MQHSVASRSSLNFESEKVHGVYRSLGGERRATGSEVVIIRNGETIADVFPDWVTRSRLDEHYYYPFDLNVPFTLTRRPDMANSYRRDPPLSEVGHISVQLLTRHLIERKIKPYVIYTAPTLACLQTAKTIQDFYGKRSAPIRIEPVLCTDSSSSGVWFDENVLRKIGYKIDQNYKGMKLNRTTHRPDRPHSETEIIAFNMKAVLRTLSDNKNAPVLFVTDALGAMMMSHYGRSLIDVKMPKSLSDAQQRASEAYPPCCASAFLSSKVQNVLTFESTDLLNPLTFCGGSTMPDLDEGIDYALNNKQTANN